MKALHIVEDCTLRAGKKFFPDGPKLLLRYFQQTARSAWGKIEVALDILKRYGIKEKVMLGKEKLLAPAKLRGLATYLYKNTIHPRFFAEALHAIAHRSTLLEPVLDHVQLLKLNRSNLAIAFQNGSIKPEEIGTHFYAFSQKSEAEKLEILVRLGVIVLISGAALPNSSNPKPTPANPDRLLTKALPQSCFYFFLPERFLFGSS